MQKQNISCSVIIVAAGKGKRMKTNINKQFININNKPILYYTLKCFDECDEINNIILVIDSDHINYCKSEILSKYDLKKEIIITTGGLERQNSVYNGIKLIDSNTDIVLIHDGVRPFIEKDLILQVAYCAYEYGGAILGVPVKDTIKVCTDNFVESTLERSKLWSVQTPQGFQYKLILRAYEEAIKDNFIGTDDSMLLERLGYKIKLIEGSYSNIKITTQDDLVVASKFLK